MLRRPLSLCAFFCSIAALLVLPTYAQAQSPQISNLTPISGAVGTLVTIVGTNFGATPGTSTVTFNGTTATPSSWSASSVTVPVPPGATTGNVVVTVGGVSSNNVSFTVATANLTLTGSLATARMFHTATLLNSGTVLVAGGVDGFAYDALSSAELYSPVTATFTTTGNLNTARIFNTATLLTNGQVLIAGGSDSNWNQVGTAELYDPASGIFTFTGSLNGTRTSHTATLLNNGKVLMVGGWNSSGGTITSDAAGSELYDPTTGTFVPSGNLNTPRDTHTATLLNDGTVLIVGGFDSNSNILSSAEVYDPVAGTFTVTGSLNVGRAVHTATLLNNGMVLIAGGYDTNGNAIASAELYDPATGSFAVTGGMNTPRYDGAQGTLLNNGMVLFAGGQDNNGNTLASAELYDPATGTFTVTGSMNATRQSLTTTLLSNGQVLVAAGMDYYANVLNSAELYQPSTLIPAGLVSIAVSPSNPSISVGTTEPFTATGTFTDNSTQTLASVTWSSSDTTIATISNDASDRGNAVAVATGSVTVSACTGSLCGSTTITVLPAVPPPSITSLSPTSGVVGTAVAITGANFGTMQGTSTVSFNGTTATTITNWGSTSIVATVPTGATTGNVVVTVGGVSSSGLNFAVQSGGFVASSGQMGISRFGQTATQLATGQILITGGMSTSGVANSAELYTPANQTFAAANVMNVARWLHTATLLNDGTVLIAGGSDLANQETLDSAEIYNPATGTFTLLSNTLNTARVGHTATLLNNGQVLIVGGSDPETGLIADAELYDPPTQTFIDLGDTNAPRYAHTATMLQNGQVLIAGGQTDPIPTAAYNTAEIFDPVSQTFMPVPVPMTTMREGHAAALLNNGQVLITGGDIPGTGSLNTAETYNPSSNTFTALAATMTVPRIFHAMTLLNGGQVLVNGGATDPPEIVTVLNTVELYDPASQTFAAAGNMTSAREHQTTSLLNDGTVLVTGGTDGTNIFNTAEIYTSSRLNGLTSIAITPAASSIGAGAQQRFTAVGTFSDGSSKRLQSVLWNSSAPNVAPISDDATNSGIAVTAAQGTTTITASAVGVSGSTTLTVTAPTLASIQLSPQNPAIAQGATQQFTATGVYTDGSTQDLTGTATWSSSATVVAGINGSGVAAGLFEGTATIQVNSGSLSASTTLSVGSPALVSIAVTPATATIALGSSQQYQAIGTYSDGSTQNVTTLLSWSSSTPAVSTISSTGLATGLSQGTVVLTGGSESVSASVTLTVAAPSLVSIIVTPNAASLSIGATQQLSAAGIYTDGSTQNLTGSTTWVSSNPSIISVSSAGLATAVAAGNATITATSGSTSGTAALVVTTGTQANLNTSRYQHSATILNNGQILVAGGVNCPTSGSCTYLSSAELYSPGTSAFTTTGAMATARSAPAVLLSSGKVLVAGGYTCDGSGNCSSLNSTEIYDPTAGTFSSAGTMTVARSGHTMTLLGDGAVLIAGGENCTSATSCSALSSAEIYDPNAGTFTSTMNGMSAARFGASAVLLDSGSVLIAGGFDGTNLPAAAEIYNPGSSQFIYTGPNLNFPRFDASAALLNNGQVLVAGGSTCNLPGCPTNAAEIYDPVANTFSIVTGGMSVPRFNHTATLLTNGDVVVAGGYSSCSSSCTGETSTEFFDPVAGTFTSGQPVATALAGHTGTLVSNGDVLLIGGINAGVTLASDEWYEPTTLTPPGLVSVTVAPASLFLTPGQIRQLVATGTFNDGSTQTLQSVIWNSSNASAAAISNSAGSAGIVNAQAQGTATLTATTGSVSGSASLEVGGLVSLTIAPANPSITVGSGQQLTAAGTFSDGSQQNLTTSVAWSSSNNSVVMIGTTTPGFQGYAMGAAVGTGTITATLGSVSANTSVTVQAATVPNPPSISTVSPPVGAAGMQITISGSGFGTTQGSGTVWLGSTYGSAVSWTNTQIVATVAAISISGTAQVQQNGLSSNAVAFNVNTATILSVSPTSGVPGTQVTITGSGFGAAQGTGQVWLGTANGVVQSWSDTQVIALVATRSNSGNAQILQNGVMSNAVSFAVNSLNITSVTPNSGGPGTSVTITGTGFGSSQGNGTAWIGSTSGQVVSWSTTQVVAVVAANAVTGIVKIEQNGVWSNAVAFTVPTSNTNALTLVPNQLNLVVSQTQTIQALNASNQPVTGLTWASSNPKVVSLSTDDPPILTALAAGSATITAGSASADVTVSYATLAPGTVIWSNPGNGSGVISIVPAVPSSRGVADVFAFQADGTVQAIKSDGTTAWTANLNGANYWDTVPDFQGGLVIVPTVQVYAGQYVATSIAKLDGITGQPNPAYTVNPATDGMSFPPVTHTDGTIFTLNYNSQNEDIYSGGTISVIGIDATTGTRKFMVPLDYSTWDSEWTGAGVPYCSPIPPSGQYTYFYAPSLVGYPNVILIAGDGYAYVAYQYYNEITVSRDVNTCNSGGSTDVDIKEHLMLMRVGSSGESSKIDVRDWEQRYSGPYSGVGGVTTGTAPGDLQVSVITNADQGVALEWESPVTCTFPTCTNTPIYGFATTSGTSASSFSVSSHVLPVLQAQDGTFYGTDDTYSNMVHFDQTGKVSWSVPNDYPAIALADGGVIGYSGITYDSNGNADGQIGNLPTKGWLGDSYQIAGSLQSVEPVPVNPATSFWAFFGGNPSGGGASAKDVFSLDGPTSSPLQTIQGSNLTGCGPQETVTKAYPFYGYARCESYTILDRNGKQIKRAGIDFDESFVPAPKPGTHTGSGYTDNKYLLWDLWAQGCSDECPLETFSEKQTITISKTGATVRVECINFGPTDVSGTDKTSDPGSPCP